MTGNNAVTWKWVAAGCLTVLLTAGGAWLNAMYSEVRTLKEEQKQDRQTSQDVKRDLDVIKERTRRTDEDVKELKTEQKEQSRKLDELLRRSR